MGNSNKHGKKTNRKNNPKHSDSKFGNMDKRVHTDAEKENANDVAWYTLYPQLVSDACNINYGYPLGSKLNFRARSNPLYNFAEGEQATLSGNSNWSVPGAMALYVTPTIGKSTDETSPINIAARNIYSYVRHANSGHANYDAPDLMLYLISMDTAYSLHAFLKRIYGLMRVMDPMNRYLNKAIVHGMGVDFDDINENLAQFRALINKMAVKVGALCIPASMSYFARHMWMYSGIYYDEEIRKAQMYFYTPYNFWKYNEYDGAGQLDYVPFMESTSDGLWTFEELRDLVNSIYESLMYSEDINIMSGDILKAYGEENIFKLSLTPDDYMVVPTFNAEVLVQIQNAYVNDGGSMVIEPITQDPTTGVLKQRIFSNTQTPILEGVKMLSVPTNNPTPALTMVATRLTSIPMVSDDNTAVEYDSFGSEVITQGAICSFTVVEGTWNFQWDKFYSDMVFNYDIGYTSDATLKHRVINKLTSFNFHPEVRVYTKNVRSGGSQYMTMSGRLYSVFNYALVDENDLRSMHEAALLSEFYVPQNGALVR